MNMYRGKGVPNHRRCNRCTNKPKERLLVSQFCLMKVSVTSLCRIPGNFPYSSVQTLSCHSISALHILHTTLETKALLYTSGLNLNLLRLVYTRWAARVHTAVKDHCSGGKHFGLIGIHHFNKDQFCDIGVQPR